MLLQVSFDALANDDPELYRHGVSYMRSYSFEKNWGLRVVKFIRLGKCLQKRPFPQRNRPILGRVSETSSAKTKKLRCYRWGWLIPAHSGIHRMIRLSSFFLV